MAARYPIEASNPEFAQPPHRSLVVLRPAQERDKDHGCHQPRHQAAEPVLPVQQAVLVQEHLRSFTVNTPSIDLCGFLRRGVICELGVARGERSSERARTKGI